MAETVFANLQQVHETPKKMRMKSFDSKKIDPVTRKGLQNGSCSKMMNNDELQQTFTSDMRKIDKN